MTPPPMTETNRQLIILAALVKYYPEGQAFHVPNGEKRDMVTAMKLKRMGVLAGVHDLIVVRPHGRVGWLEVKTDVGVLSKEQIKIHAQWASMGHDSHVVRDLEDILKIIEQWKNEDSKNR